MYTDEHSALDQCQFLKKIGKIVQNSSHFEVVETRLLKY